MEHRTFDNLFTTNHLQMLKVLLPCLPPDKQGGLAIYIKMQELMYTISYIRKHGRQISESLEPQPADESLLERLLPFCNESQKNQLQQFRQMRQEMDNIREMMDMAQMMQEMFPGGMDMENMDLSQLMGMFPGSPPDSPTDSPEEPPTEGTPNQKEA